MKTLALLPIAALVYGCAASQKQNLAPQYFDYVPVNQIQVKSKLDTVALTKENLVSEHQKCVPYIQPDSELMKNAVRAFPQKNASITVSHQIAARQFLYHESTGVCLAFSTNWYPIYAAETIVGTVNPAGVPPDVVDEWYMSIALKIAVNGRAKVAYVTNIGTAFIASYWVAQPRSAALNYWAEFKSTGTWENTVVDFRFGHPELRGLSETKRGETNRMTKEFPSATGH